VIEDNQSVTLKLPKIYPITDTRVSGLSHADQVARLIDGGATLVQLRDKQSTAKDFLREAGAAMAVARQSNAQLIINDRVDIALAVGADGVHLGQTDLPAEVARRLLKDGSLIGSSTHNLEQVRAAARLPVDYVAFGPIFPTQTKKDHDPIAGLDGLKSARKILNGIPLVAIGGITLENCHEVFEAGADAIAVIQALLADPPKITEIMNQLLARARE
jgi:thiamine-phosphate pyrophosphorylase